MKQRDEQYVGCKVVEMILPGRRRHGRPKLRWMDSVKRNLEAMGARDEDVLGQTSWKKKTLCNRYFDSTTAPLYINPQHYQLTKTSYKPICRKNF